ncbi:MAG TPA: hypothetical protein VFW90_00390 [Candidatus Saccharimonadales bacterium]|nr:hypothetical protein [Candidatus Saccharimonadales bacterium]
MAKRAVKKTEEQILMRQWWVRAILAVVFILIAYGFASLAIDSAHFWEYVLAVIFVWFGVKHAITAVRFAFSH